MSRTVSGDGLEAKRFKALAHSLAGMVWVAAGDGQVEDMPDWRAYTGQTVEEVRGRGWLDALHPEDRDRARQAWAAAVGTAGDTPYDMEYRVLGGDGEYRWFHARGVPVLDEQEVVREWVGVCVDVDHRRRNRAERERLLGELERERERLRAVFSQAPVAASIVSGPDFVFDLANPLYEELVGRTDLVGKPLREAFPELPEDAPLLRNLRDVFVSGKPFRADRCRVRIDRGGQGVLEDVFFQFTCQPVRNAEGQVTSLLTIAVDVTDRVRAEEAAKASEEQLRATFDKAAVGLAHVDLEGGWFRVNDRLCVILGRPREELTRLSFQDITHPDDLAADLELLQRLLAGDIDHYAMEKRYLRPDGSMVWAHLTVALVRSQDERPDYFISVIQDISQQKDAEERLRGAERHLRAVIDSMFAFVGVTTPDGILVEANRAALEAAGLKPEDVLGRPFEDTYWWSYEPAVQQRLREAIERAAAGEPSRYDVVVRLGPDRFEPIDFIIAPLQDEHGRVTHLVPSAMVITERVQAEEAVRDSEARFRALADNIPQLAWMTDAEGWIFWYNRRWFEYTGTTLEEMEGWGWRRAHHPDHVDRVVERFRRAIQSGELWEDTFPLRSRTGEYRWFLSRAQPIRDADGHISLWFGTNTDITEDRQAAAERERLLEEVRAASDAKSDFMAVMSHELRTPLNAIIGYADLLDMGVPAALPGAARSAIGRIRLAASHQRQLIDDILTFSRLEAGQEEVEVEIVPLEELLDEIDAVIAPLATRKGLDLGIVADGTSEIRTDPRKLRQILVNLLGNAVKFTEAGRVELRVEEEPESFRLVVEDTGVGISSDGAARVFDPFWQAESGRTRTAGGSGLGLSIAQRYARLLGGEISVDSEVGRGSRFTLILTRPPAPDPRPG
jgi:PAS domain S-box-containing protein